MPTAPPNPYRGEVLNSGPFGLVFIVPITKTTGRNIPFHVLISPQESGLTFDSAIMCEQLRSVSKSRFFNRVGQRMTPAVMKRVEDTLKILLSIR